MDRVYDANMDSLSGLVLDVYDDVGGNVLRALYPNFDDIPATVKTAAVVSGANLGERLPDDVFALVLVNNGEKLRKYACIDKGNTILSVQYFLKTAHKLPAEAQKVAAENLKVACGWYDLEVPEPLEKVALGLQTALTAAMAVPIARGTSQTIKENLAANRDLSQQGVGIVTPHMRDAYLGRKTAETTGTVLMPNQPPGNLTPSKPKAMVAKTATIGRLVSASKGDKVVEPDIVHPPTEEQAPGHPQAKHMRPTVNVSNQVPPKALVEKKASVFALPGEQKYPLDSYIQVKTASEYFDTYANHMSPQMRREFAANLVKRAQDLDIDTSDLVRKYGAGTFAPEEEIKAAFDARRLEVAHNKAALDLLGEVEKVARFRMWKEASVETPKSYEPHEVVELLAEFDKVAGLEHHYDRTIPDPYYSIYGFEKTAKEDAYSEVIGNEMVTEADLKRLARIGALGVKTTFGMEFQEEFLKDPVGIFKSMPLAQKKMLMRMANSTQPGAERNY
jgi:hypothetical protein